MFEFIKKMIVLTMSLFSRIALSITPLKCVSMNNRKFKVRSEIININSNELVFFSF